MERHPVRDRFNNIKARLGNFVVTQLEKRDDALDVFENEDDLPELDFDDERFVRGQE